MQDPREEVIQAWYMDDSDEDQRLPHHKDPKEFVSLDQLSGKHLCKYLDLMIWWYGQTLSLQPLLDM